MTQIIADGKRSAASGVWRRRSCGKNREDNPVGMRRSFAWAWHVIVWIHVMCLPEVSQAADREFQRAWSVELPGVGEARDLAIADQTLFYATPRGIVIFDANDPASPSLLGGLTLFQDPDELGLFKRGIAVQGDWAYVGGAGELHVVNVSDRRAPWRVSRMHLTSSMPMNLEELQVVDVAVDRDLLCLALQNGRVLFFALSDPQRPDLIVEMDLEKTVRQVLLESGYAYLGTGGNTQGLNIIDVRDPSNPAVAFPFIRPGNVMSMALVGEQLHLAGGPSGFFVVDVSDPGNPLMLGSIYLVGFVSDVVVRDGLAYVSLGNDARQMVVVDVRNPHRLEEVARFTEVLKGTSERLDLLDKDHLLIEMQQCFDMKETLKPRYLVSLSPRLWPHDMAIQEDRIFFANGYNGLWMLDITDWNRPRWLGNLPVVGTVSSMAASGDVVYVGASPFRQDGVRVAGDGLVAVNLSDPEHPVVLDSLPEDTLMNAMDVSKDTLYLATEDGLRVVDVSDASNLRLEGNLLMGERVWKVGVYENTAQLTVGDPFEIMRLDVSNPQKPVWIDPPEGIPPGDTENVPRGFQLEFLDADHVIVSREENHDWGVVANDLYFMREGQEAQLLGRHLTSNSFFFDVHNGHLFVLSLSGSELSAIHLNQPANPQHRASHDLLAVEDPWHQDTFATLSGSLLYLTEESVGIDIFELSDSDTPRHLASWSMEDLGIESRAELNTLQAFPGSDLLFIQFHLNQAVTQIMDVSNPVAPVLLTRLKSPMIPLAITDNLVYGHWEGRVEIMDFSNPVSPQLAGRIPLGEDRRIENMSMTLKEDRAYFLTEHAFSIVDVPEPSAAKLLSQIVIEEANLEYASEVAVVGNHAYLAAGYAGMIIIDISDDEAPKVAGRLPGSAASLETRGHASLGAFSDIDVRGSIAYLFDSHQGRLVVADVSDPISPSVIGRNTLFAGEGHAASMEVTDEAVLVAFRRPGQNDPDLVVFDHFLLLRFCPVFAGEQGSIQLFLEGPAGQHIRVQRSQDLRSWSEWKTVTLEDEGCEIVDDIQGQGQFFYRALMEE